MGGDVFLWVPLCLTWYVVQIIRTKSRRQERRRQKTWCAYQGICIKRSLAIPKDIPEGVGGPYTRITTTYTRELSIHPSIRRKKVLTAVRLMKGSCLHHPSHFVYDTGELYRVEDRNSAQLRERPRAGYASGSSIVLQCLFGCPSYKLFLTCVSIRNRGLVNGNGSLRSRLLSMTRVITSEIEETGSAIPESLRTGTCLTELEKGGKKQGRTILHSQRTTLAF